MKPKSATTLRQDEWQLSKLYIENARLGFEKVLKPAVFLVPGGVRVIPRFSSFQPEGMYIEWGRFRSHFSREPAYLTGFSAERRSAAKCLIAFLSLADAEDKQSDRFVDFARRYGVLGILPYVFDETTDSGTIRHSWESVDLWRQFARRCRAIIDVGAEIVNGRLGGRKSWRELIDEQGLRSLGYHPDQFFVELSMQKTILVWLLNTMLQHIASRPQIVWQEQVPTVMLEMAYMTDRWDEKRLDERMLEKARSPRFQDHIRKAVEEEYAKAGTLGSAPFQSKEGEDDFWDSIFEMEYEELSSELTSEDVSRHTTREPWMREVEWEDHFAGKQVLTDFRSPFMFLRANLRPSTLFNVILTQIIATLAAPDGLTRCHVCDVAYIPERKPARGTAPLCGNADCEKKRHNELSRLRMRRKREEEAQEAGGGARERKRRKRREAAQEG